MQDLLEHNIVLIDTVVILLFSWDYRNIIFTQNDFDCDGAVSHLARLAIYYTSNSALNIL